MDSTVLNLIKAKAKTTLRIKSASFDDEISGLILSAEKDLNLSGIDTSGLYVEQTFDSILLIAILTYVRVHFGSPDDYERLKLSYDEQKAQLKVAGDYIGEN